jgi:hypothetical protein
MGSKPKAQADCNQRGCSEGYAEPNPALHQQTNGRNGQSSLLPGKKTMGQNVSRKHKKVSTASTALNNPGHDVSTPVAEQK